MLAEDDVREDAGEDEARPSLVTVNGNDIDVDLGASHAHFTSTLVALISSSSPPPTSSLPLSLPPSFPTQAPNPT